MNKMYDKYMNSQLSNQINQFISQVNDLEIVLNEEQIEQFLLYYELLIEWNSFMNLTAITSLEEVLQKHFIDSLSLVHCNDLNNSITIMDIGTGAGFPGIPLKIAFPNLKITLLDSLNKRVKFLNHVINELKLNNITALHGRAEDYAHNLNHRESYDLVVSRAVANLSTLSEYCIPYCKIGGYFISYKSEKIVEESEFAKKAIHLLGAKYEKQNEFYLPNTKIYRNLYIVKKIEKTAMKYPRKAGLPGKEPL